MSFPIRANFSIIPSSSTYMMGVSVSSLPTAFKNAVRRALQAIAELFSMIRSKVCSFFTKKVHVQPQPQPESQPQPQPQPQIVPPPVEVLMDEIDRAQMQACYRKAHTGLVGMLKHVWISHAHQDEKTKLKELYEKEYTKAFAQKAPKVEEIACAALMTGMKEIAVSWGIRMMPEKTQDFFDHTMTKEQKDAFIKKWVDQFPKTASEPRNEKETLALWMQSVSLNLNSLASVA